MAEREDRRRPDGRTLFEDEALVQLADGAIVTVKESGLPIRELDSSTPASLPPAVVEACDQLYDEMQDGGAMVPQLNKLFDSLPDERYIWGPGYSMHKAHLVAQRLVELLPAGAKIITVPTVDPADFDPTSPPGTVN